jgi:hypothetical protein
VRAARHFEGGLVAEDPLDYIMAAETEHDDLRSALVGDASDRGGWLALPDIDVRRVQVAFAGERFALAPYTPGELVAKTAGQSLVTRQWGVRYERRCGRIHRNDLDVRADASSDSAPYGQRARTFRPSVGCDDDWAGRAGGAMRHS